MKLTELRQKSAPELGELLASKKAELLELNLALITQKSKATHSKAILRKDIARIATIRSEQSYAAKEIK